MWNLFHFYWIAARGFRLCPWKSPYLQWRFETFLGREADHLDARKFFRISWKYRHRLQSFSNWAADRRKFQRGHA